jgi:molecular chaperone HscB
MTIETYFSLFGLPAQFSVDEAALDKQYLALQLQHHPDRMIGKTPEEKAASMQQSVRINDGWHTLKSPLKRALYMLALRGVEPAKPGEALLTEAMAQREELEKMDTAECIKELDEQARERMAECIEAVAQAFGKGDIVGAAHAITRLQYLEKFEAEIRLKKLKGMAT